MKRKALAAVGAALVFAVSGTAAYADYGYDGGDYGYDNGYTYDDGYSYDYGYDDTWTDQTYDDGTGYYDDGTGYSDAVTELESGTDSVLTEADLNKPAVITLVPSKIKNESFTADLKIESNHKITAADLTVNYDSNVVKLVNNRINTEAGGDAAAAETQPGTLQYQMTNAAGSDWKESYLTLKFQITELTERSTVLYIAVNSLTDEENNELTYRADGTIIQIEGAVEIDPSADESMYTELRVAKSDSPIAFESIGLTDVKSAAFTDKSVADLTEGGFATLKIGITNLTIEHNDGSLAYYRLVVADPADLTAPAEETAPAETVATTQETGIVKTETGHSPKKIMYILIYVVVLIAVIAVIVEFFIYYGNPYKKTADILKSAPPRPKAPKPNMLDEDMFPEAAESPKAPAEAEGYAEEESPDGGDYSEEDYEQEEYYDDDGSEGEYYEEGEYAEETEQAEYTSGEDEEYYEEDDEAEEYYEDTDAEYVEDAEYEEADEDTEVSGAEEPADTDSKTEE